MKKWIPFTVILFVAVGFFFYFQQKNSVSEDKIVTMKKSESGIEQHVALQEEIQVHQKLHPIPEAEKEESGRKPSSLATHPNYPDRKIIGNHPDLLERQAINQYNNHWKEKLGNDLLRFHPEGTKLVIEEELSLVQVRKEHTRLIQQVLVSYINTNGRHSSYRAFVDSETAEIVQTWDRTIFEDYKGKPLSLTPSGSL